MKPGNSGGGKDPDFWSAFEDGEDRVIGDEPATPEKIRILQRKLYGKSKAEPGNPCRVIRWRGIQCRMTCDESNRREAMGRAAEVVAPSSSIRTDGGYPVAQVNDLSRSLTAFDPISTLVVVVEMSKAKWLVSGAVPGVERQPLKKLEPDATALLRLIERWRSEAVRAGRPTRSTASRRQGTGPCRQGCRCWRCRRR